MCGIYCVYKQSRSCQLPFVPALYSTLKLEIFPFTYSFTIRVVQQLSVVHAVLPQWFSGSVLP